MRTATAIVPDGSPAVRRLESLAPLDPESRELLDVAAARPRYVKVRRELINEGSEIAESLILLEGWAARVRVLIDGRRQFMSFVLPGDLIGMCRQANPVAVSTVVALTDLQVCVAPSAEGFPALHEAYSVSGAMEEAHLLAQITRLGRMNAQERIADLLLELHERLSLAGLVDDESYLLPLTQEAFADVLGLTPVHVNRMLQEMRRHNELKWKGGRLKLIDPAGLARRVGRIPVKVTASA